MEASRVGELSQVKKIEFLFIPWLHLLIMDLPSSSVGLILFLVIAPSIFGIGYGQNGTFNVLDFGAIGNGVVDDSQAFLAAWKRVCGTVGGTQTLQIPPYRTFMLQPLKFTGPCKAYRVVIQILGNIEAPSSLSEWEGCESGCWLCFSYVRNLIIMGRGQLHGRGSLWWNQHPTPQFLHNTNDSTHKNVITSNCKPPAALKFYKCELLQLREFTSVNSPRNHISTNGCRGVTISNVHLNAPGYSPNTDGISITGTTQVNILDSLIQTGDDCISIKGGSSFINISHVTCGPGHGISVGSLGQKGVVDRVEQVYVYNCSFFNTQNGARIKTWPGGSGYARAISFKQITVTETKHPIIINQNYFNDEGSVKVSDVTFSGFQGTSASAQAITLDCSKLGCTNIVMDHVNLTSMLPGKPLRSFCKNAYGRSSFTTPHVPCLSKLI